jgi:hypothetical protein
MPNFDINQYLANRLGSTETNAKLQQIAAASQTKIAELDAKRAAVEAQQAADKKAYEESWVGQLGLNPTGFVANRVNDVASVVSGASRLVGNTAALPTSLMSFNDMSAVNQQELDAYNRVKEGKPLLGDVGLLNTPKDQSGVTPLARIENANKAREASRDINNTFDLSKTVDPTNRRNLEKDLGRDFDRNWDQVKSGWEDGSATNVAKGLAGLLSNAGSAILTNPSAVREYVLENAPQLLIGAAPGGQALMGATNIGYAVDTYQQGIENYMKANGGQMPPEEQMQTMAWQAASLALAEQAGDVVGLSAARLTGKAVKEASQGAGKGILKAIGEGFASEAPTEGYQTYMEGEVTGKPASAKDIYTGAVIGGASGAGLVGGIRVAQEATGTTPEHLEQRQAAADKAKVVADAVASGDVSPLLDDKSQNYSPTTAIGVLQKLASAPETSDEDKQAHLAKANEIVSGLEKQRRGIEGSLERTSIEGTQKQLDKAKEALAALDPAETDKIEAKKEEIDLLTEHLDSVKAEKPKVLAGEAKAYQRQLEQLDEHLTSARTALETMNVESHKDIDVAAEVAKITGEDTGVSQTAADRIINLSMASPERLDPKIASQLANNASLTDSQRSYFRAFDEARQAEHAAKGLEGVSTDIFTGSKNYVGLNQYRTNVQGALASADRGTADKQLKQLGDFATDHQAKATAVAQAWQQFQQDKTQPLMVVSDGNRGWTIQAGNEADAKVRAAAGTVNINEKSSKLVKAITAEAAAINSAHAELTAATQHKAAPSPSLVTSAPARIIESKSDGTQAPETKQTEKEGSQAPAAAGQERAPAEQSIEEPAVSDTGQQREVEASGVTETASDAGASGSSVNNEATDVVVEPEVATTEEGTLSALREKSPEGTAFISKKAGDFFRQFGSSPLVKVKDFLSALRSKKVSLIAFLPEDSKKLTNEQERVIRMLSTLANNWGPLIQKDLKLKKNPEFNYEDPSQYFINKAEDGSLSFDENIVTAMVYAAIATVDELANRGALNDAKSINSLLNRDSDHEVSDREYALLSTVGVRENILRNSIGRKVMQAAGLKGIKDAVPLDVLAKLESAFGAHVEKLLIGQGILKRTTMPQEQMAELFGDQASTVGKFLRLAWSKDHKPMGLADQMVTTLRGTGNILDNLFHADSSKIFPTLKPVKAQSTTDSGKPLPANIQTALDLQNKEPNRLDEGMWNLLGKLTDDTIVRLAGGRESNPNVDQAMTRKGLDAKLQGLYRELDRYREFVTSVLQPVGFGTEFFYDHYAGDTDRSYTRTNMFNPVTSKMHRHLAFRTSWETKYDRNNDDQMQTFKLRVMEGFGIKTERQMIETLMAGNTYSKVVNDPVVQAAVEILRDVTYGERSKLGQLSEDDQQTLMKAVAKGKERFHTLAALMALAEEAHAVATESNTFTSRITGEVDGVANGAVITQLIYGGANSLTDLQQRMEMGGLYSKDSGITSFSQWRSTAGNRDTYESLTGKLLTALRTAWNRRGTNQRALTAISRFLGPLDNKTTGTIESAGRNLSKNPITTLMYSSAVYTSVDTMASYMIEGIQSSIQKAVAARDDVQRKQIIEDLNTLLGSRQFSPSTSFKELLDLDLTDDQLKSIRKTFHDSFGKTAQSSLKSEYGAYLQGRDLFNKTNQATFEVFDIIHKGVREAYIKQLVEAKEIKLDTKGNPIHGLTAAQEAEVQKRLRQINPVLASVNSLRDGKVDTGLALRKGTTKQSTNPVYAGNTGFATPFADTLKWKQPLSSADTVAQEKVFEGPGIRLSSASTHSNDAGISHGAQAELIGHDVPVINIHDALITGAKTIGDAATALNKAFFQSVLEYSPMREALNTLDRTLAGVLNLKNEADGFISESTWNGLPMLIDSLDLPSLVKELGEAAYRAEQMKLELLKNTAVVDQYASEGAAYEVTNKDREAIDKRLADLVQLDGLTQQVLAKIQELGIEPGAAKPVQTQQNIWGEVGTSLSGAEPDLVVFFDKTPKSTAGAVIEHLMAQPNVSAINRKLLALVRRTINLETPVQLVTPDTAEDAVIQKPLVDAKGWFVATRDGSAVYVRSAEFVHGGMSVETLLHELIHAALAQTIGNPKGDGVALVRELEELLEACRKYVADNDIVGWGAALKDVQELVAWGLSNRDFQASVLANVKMESKTKNNALVTAMQRFIETLTKFFFKKPDENINSGLTVLIQNVSGLAYQAAQEQAKSKEPTEINLAQESVERVEQYTTQEIFESLGSGSISPTFADHLSGLLSGIVDKLHGPFGAFADAMRKTEAGNPMAVWLKAMETGVAPFASSIVAFGFAASAQEDFAMQQVESTVRAALENNEATTTAIYRELIGLYNEARAQLKPSDFASQADYDFVFKMESTNGNRSDYLSRFAALGLANEKFNGLLKFETKTDRTDWFEGETLADRLLHLFTKILSIFNQKLAHVYAGQAADAKLTALVGQLVDIEARKRHDIKLRESSNMTVAANIEAKVQKTVQAAKEKVAKLAESKVIKDSGSALVQAGGVAVRIIAREQTEHFLENLRKFRDKQLNEVHGLAMSMLNELKGPLQNFEVLLRATKHLESLRKGIITQHAKLALNTFLKGDEMSMEQKASISAVFMRTGMHNLLQHFTLAQIEKMVGDTAEVDKAISNFEGQLSGSMKDRWIEQVNALGYYKATGRVRTPVLMFNAYSIARMMGTQFNRRITEQQAKEAENTLAALTALYALRYTEEADQQVAKQMLRDENNRSDGANGVQFVLQLHKELEADSLARLFKGNPALMMHGYTPEILNPHTAMKVANTADGADLVQQGYVKGGKVVSDITDPNQESQHIYVLKDGGLAPYLSAAVSLSSLHAKGTTKHNGYTNASTSVGLDNASTQAGITHDKLQLLSQWTNPKRDLRNDGRNQMAPVFNEQGEIVNWRYMMAESTKNDLLERDNRFDQILGAHAGSIFDKETSAKQNKEIVTAVRDQYDQDYHTNPDGYILVGAKSTDPELRDTWHLLPAAMQEEIRRVWGRDGMMVRKDSVDILFGYRKFSLGEMFAKDPAARRGFEKFLMTTLEQLFVHRGYSIDEARNLVKKVGMYVTRGERMWQEVVREAKDIIVVKSGVVLLGNIWSNFSLLVAKGVPFKDILHYHQVAIQGALAYQNDTRRLAELETLVRTGMKSDEATRREIVQLKDKIDRNPVKPLMDEGLMTSIVEDVAEEDDPFSYKTEFARKMEKYTSRINPKVMNAAKLLYMDKESWMYQNLSRVTQLSDFVARYTLYQHATTRQENPLSHTAAIQEASDAFVNYDIPMYKGLQYSDDMGITMFTKYFLRIQKVLLKTMRENPGRVLTMALLNKYLALGPIVLESSFVHHLGNNPFHLGALDYVGSLGELATTHSALALVK